MPLAFTSSVSCLVQGAFLPILASFKAWTKVLVVHLLVLFKTPSSKPQTPTSHLHTHHPPPKCKPYNGLWYWSSPTLRESALSLTPLLSICFLSFVSTFSFSYNLQIAEFLFKSLLLLVKSITHLLLQIKMLLCSGYLYVHARYILTNLEIACILHVEIIWCRNGLLFYPKAVFCSTGLDLLHQ